MTDYWTEIFALDRKHRRQKNKERRRQLSETYRASPPGEETPEALEAIDELAKIAIEDKNRTP